MKKKNIQAKDKVYSPCILLSRLKFRFDILKMQRKILAELPKDLGANKDEAFLHNLLCPLSNT